MMKSSFGLVTKINALPGKHSQLVEVLQGVTQLAFRIPGCMYYVVSNVSADPDSVFITEFWDTRASQQSAFAMAGIHEVMVQAQVLTRDFQQHELQPLAS